MVNVDKIGFGGVHGLLEGRQVNTEVFRAIRAPETFDTHCRGHCAGLNHVFANLSSGRSYAISS